MHTDATITASEIVLCLYLNVGHAQVTVMEQ